MKSSIIFKFFYLAAAMTLALLISSCGESENCDINIVTKDGDSYISNYSIIFGEDCGTYADELSDLINEIYSFKPECLADISNNSCELEILIGTGERADYSELTERATDGYPTELYYTWGYSVTDNKVLLYFSHDVYAKDKLFELIRPLMKRSGFTLSRDAEVIKHRSIYLEQTEEGLRDQISEMGSMKERFYKALEINNALLCENGKNHLASFGGSITENLSDISDKSYPLPDIFPNKGEHPRINVNKDLLNLVKSAFDSNDYLDIKTELMALADNDFDGKFEPSEQIYEECDTSKLISVIEAKALVYLITGKTAYGYEALAGIKQALSSIPIMNESTVSYLVTVSAEVYDWCYNILNGKDKEQLIAGVEKCIKSLGDNGIGFPPKRLSASIFNTEADEMLSAYLAFSAAIYDEYPDWWNFCAGRFYSEFKESASAYLKSGAIPGGSAHYASENLYVYLKITGLLSALGADIPYENIDKAYTYLFAHALPSGRIFMTGDSSYNGEPSAEMYYKICIMSAALFDDAEALYYGKLYSGGYEKFEYSSHGGWTPINALLYVSDIQGLSAIEPTLPLVKYNGSPAGQIIVRNSLDENAAVVLMKVGETFGIEHEHLDSGTFQIYYKGLLSDTSGVYDGEISNHQKYYNEATVSKNGLLIFDPALYKKPEFDNDGNIINPDEAFYTGGQTGTVGEAVQSSSYFYSYNKDGTAPRYAYSSADYTSAYDKRTTEFAERRMLTVYTENPDFPMLLIVFDRVISKNQNAQKKFLLQAGTEPTIADTDGDSIPDSVIINEYDGTLVLTPIIGANNIEKIGGEGSSFSVNGYQLTPNSSQSTDSSLSMWGRAEISASGETKTNMLNLLYVKDAENDAYLSPISIETDLLSGVQIGGEMMIFVNDSSQNLQVLEFETNRYESESAAGVEDINCFVSGIKAGAYTILVDGVKHSSAICPADKDVLTFTVPQGKITLVRSDI